MEKIFIDKINFGPRFRKEYKNVESLAASIKKLGLIQPITVAKDGAFFRLLAGGRRIRACRLLGWSKIDARVIDVDDLKARECERDENEEREPYTTSERVEIGKEIERLLGERRGGDRKSPAAKSISANAANDPNGRTIDIAAKAAGFSSGDTYERAKKVVDNGTPELVEAMDAGEISISAAAKQTREKPSDADETLRDEVGHVVPAPTVPAFGSLATFREIDSLIRQLQKKLDELARVPGGEQLKPCLRPTGSEDKVLYKSEELNALKRHLNGTRPYSICSYCAGKAKKDCKGCSGRGWVSKSTWENTADDLKARIA